MSKAFSIAIFSLVGEGGPTTQMPTPRKVSTSSEQGTAATTLGISGNFKYVLVCLKYVQTGKYEGCYQHGGNADHQKLDCISQNPLQSSSALESTTLVCQVQQGDLWEPAPEMSRDSHLKHQALKPPALLQHQVRQLLQVLVSALSYARRSTKMTVVNMNGHRYHEGLHL